VKREPNGELIPAGEAGSPTRSHRKGPSTWDRSRVRDVKEPEVLAAFFFEPTAELVPRGEGQAARRRGRRTASRQSLQKVRCRPWRKLPRGLR
jgi:hypothetical protein